MKGRGEKGHPPLEDSSPFERHPCKLLRRVAIETSINRVFSFHIFVPGKCAVSPFPSVHRFDSIPHLYMG